MSTCGCTDTNPATPLPPNCNAIPVYAEPVAPDTSPCCMACVFDDLEANWVKPVGEATALLPVCDVTRFRADQCVAVVGTNGLGGVYKIEAVLTDEIELSIYDGTTYDIGGAGTVQGGRVYLLPVCPLTQAALIANIESAIPSEFTLAVHASSDSAHGFSLAVDTGQIKLVYNQTNFEAQVATAIANIGITTDIAAYLNSLGVSLFYPVTNTTQLTLFATEAAASGTIDIATDFAEVIPANATHARLLIDFFVSAGHDNGGAVAGDCSQMVGELEFAGSSQFRLDRGSESIYPTVQSTQGASLRDLGSRAQVALDIPMTAGMIDWDYTRTIWPATGRIEAGNDAEGSVRLLGFLITP